MAILIGHASISENGTINGQKGDQTGKEVCTRNWYNHPWDYLAIHPDATVREKHAKAVEAGCANNNIGYGQNDRNTLNTEAKKVNYDLSKVGLCNTDCSEFMNVCAVASGAPGVTHASNGWTTSTMKSALQNAGYKIITDKSYLTSEDYCVRGAIYVKSGSHTVCGLINGSKSNQTLSKAGLASSSSTTTSSNTATTNNSTYTGNSLVDYLKSVGIDSNFANRQKLASQYGISGYTGTAAQNTTLLSKLRSNASNTTNTSSSAQSSSSSIPNYSVGKIYVTQAEMIVRKSYGTSSSPVGYSGLTDDAKKHDSDKDGAIDKGTSVTCKAVKNVGNDIWIQIPSGWIAAYHQGNIYVK